jgi:hypothetical protein
VNLEGDRGYLGVRIEGRIAFKAPFTVRHFAVGHNPVAVGRGLRILVRVTGLGPRAVPLRFGLRESGLDPE